MRDERRDGPVREGSRFQGLSLSGEPDKSPDGSPVNRGRGALWAEKGIGSAPTNLIVAVSVQFALIAASKVPLGRFIGERRRTSVGARPMLRTTETWLSVDLRSSASGAGRDFSANLRVGWLSGTMLDLREEAGDRSFADAIVEMGRGDGKFGRDWRRETICERRCVIVLCRSRGLEMLARTPESLSLRVPRNSLALSVSRMRNSSLRSGLKNTLTYKKHSRKEARTPL